MAHLTGHEIISGKTVVGQYKSSAPQKSKIDFDIMTAQRLIRPTNTVRRDNLLILHDFVTKGSSCLTHLTEQKERPISTENNEPNLTNSRRQLQPADDLHNLLTVSHVRIFHQLYEDKLNDLN